MPAKIDTIISLFAVRNKKEQREKGHTQRARGGHFRDAVSLNYLCALKHKGTHRYGGSNFEKKEKRGGESIKNLFIAGPREREE